MIHADRLFVLVGVAVLGLGLSSRLVKRHSLSPMVLALGLGVLVGPHALDLIDPTAVVGRDVLLEQLSRVALAIAVVGIALRTRPSDLRADRRRLVVLLAVVMPAMWLVSSLGAGLLLGFPVALALLLGAALTPTDPGVASALVTGVLPNRQLPRRVRMTLQLEAGANDGLAVPFVLFAGLLASVPGDEVLGRWAVEAVREVGLAIVVGAAAGLLARWLTDRAGVQRLAEEDWFPLASIGLALTVLGAVHLLGGSGILAAFVAGLFFSEGLPEDLRDPIDHVHRSATQLAVTIALLAFGMVLPVDEWWPMLGLPGVAFALWILVLRRLPLTYPAVRATGTGTISSAFIGWSGPLGVAAIYYLAAAEHFSAQHPERLFVAGSLAITASVVGQAVSATAAVHAYRRASGQEVPEGELLDLEGPLP